MSDQEHCLPDKAVAEILQCKTGHALPTVICGVIVAATEDGLGLRIVSIDEACEMIRRFQAPRILPSENSLRMVLAMGNRYTC